MISASEEELYRTLTTKVLFRYPFDTANVGFKMLIEAVVLTLESTEPFINTRGIFEKIARKRKIKTASIDKSIKKAIDNITAVIDFDKEDYHNALMRQAFINGKPKGLVLATRETVKSELDTYIRNLKID